MRPVALALAEWAVEFGYGDVVSRPGPDLRTRQLATAAALTALGTAAPQSRSHLNGVLNFGRTPLEIIEVIQPMAAFAGFPAAREVFGARGLQFVPAAPV